MVHLYSQLGELIMLIFPFPAYFKSLLAFELISVFAVFIGTVIASVAMVQQHPLVVLVAGFTMIFSGELMTFSTDLRAG